MPHSACLAVGSAAAHSDPRVVFVRRAGNRERLKRDHAQGLHWEIVLHGTPIHDDFASAGFETHARNRGLATASAEMPASVRFKSLYFSHRKSVERRVSG